MISGHQKWHGKSTLIRAAFETDMEFTVPAI